MSRVAKKPIAIPSGVNLTIQGQKVIAKGPKGSLEYDMPIYFLAKSENGEVTVVEREDVHVREKQKRMVNALAGTTRANLNNMFLGVSRLYEKKLELVGVGYRGQVKGKKVVLNLGFSQPIEMDIPKDITIEMPSQTEIVVKGVSKHLVGEVAAHIRSFREVEPYKGKGVRYSGERVILKETKKK